MVVGWNLYQGWYSGNIQGFPEFLDRHHAEFPNKPLMVTEYGADADPRIRSLTPERFDKSIDYSLNFHEFYYKAIKDRPFVAAAMIWNLADFNSESREETMPHINNKGLLTLDRTPKDLYSFYQSQLLKTPFVKISNWDNRVGLVDSLGASCTQSLDVFSNAANVELIVNGKSLGEQKRKTGKRFTWMVPFKQGKNSVEALIGENGNTYRDVKEVNFDVLSYRDPETEFNSLNVLLGAKRIFIEEGTKQTWVPDKRYKAGSWGSVGGEAFILNGNARQAYGTDRNIRKSENDPIYQSQQVGIRQYKLDVPDGEYQLTLHFAELLSGEVKEALANNLDNSSRKDLAEERVFDIVVNDVPFLNNFNIRQKYGALTAGSEVLLVYAKNGVGIKISFNPIIGKAVLNALQLVKKY
jgi:beta-galactosidase